MKLGKSVEWPSEENPLNFDGYATYFLFVLLLCRISRIQLRGQPSTESSKVAGEWWEVGPLAMLANRVANLRMKCYCFTKDGYIRAGRCRRAGFCANSDETASNSHLQLFIHPWYSAMERSEDCGAAPTSATHNRIVHNLNTFGNALWHTWVVSLAYHRKVNYWLWWRYALSPSALLVLMLHLFFGYIRWLTVILITNLLIIL